MQNEGYIVKLLVGFQGAGKRTPGQLIHATLVFANGGGEEPIGFKTEGVFLNDRADAKLRHRCWRIVKRTLMPGDSIRFDVATGVKGAGEDSRTSGAWLYVLDPDAPIRDYRVPNVGPKDVPLIKGRLIEIAVATKHDKLEDERQQFISDTDGM